MNERLTRIAALKRAAEIRASGKRPVLHPVVILQTGTDEYLGPGNELMTRRELDDYLWRTENVDGLPAVVIEFDRNLFDEPGEMMPGNCD